MNKLLFAGFARLRRDLAFWVCFLGMAALGVYIPVGQYFDSMRYNTTFSLDGTVFNYVPFICLAAAVFISLYLGVDYSDGTIRNKMMVGRTRNEIYMSNWAVCVSGSLLICLAFALPCTAFAILLLGPAKAPAGALALVAALSVLVAAAISSVYVMVSMLCHNKAVSAVACLVFVIALFIAATVINGALSEPPTYDGMAIFTENGMEILDESTPNPAYLTGTKRAVYEFLNDFLPVNQAIQCAGVTIANPLRFALCDLGIILTSILTGLGLFQRKDLK